MRTEKKEGGERERERERERAEPVMKKLLNRLRRNAGPLFCMLVSREEALNLARHERKQPQRCGLSCGARTMLSVLPLIARPQALKTQPQLSVFPLIARPQALKTQPQR